MIAAAITAWIAGGALVGLLWGRFVQVGMLELQQETQP